MPDTHAAPGFVRIGLAGDVGCQDVGSRAVLESNLWRIRRLFGGNCALYVFSDEVSATAINLQGLPVVCLDSLRSLVEEAGGHPEDVARKLEGLRLSDPDTESLGRHALLHEVFSNLDVLCLMGGSYLSEGSSRVLTELWAAATLAQRYGVKVAGTGLSLAHAGLNQHARIVADILACCDTVDLRDGVRPSEFSEILAGVTELSCSTDDAVGYLPRVTGATRAEVFCEIAAAQEGRFFNLSLPHGLGDTAGLKDMLSWAGALATSSAADCVNVLAFDSRQSALLREFAKASSAGLPQGVRLVDLTAVPLSSAYQLVEKAQLNLCSSLHHALFAARARTRMVGVDDGGVESPCLVAACEALGVATWSDSELMRLAVDELVEASMESAASQEALGQLAASKDDALCQALATDAMPAALLREQLCVDEPIKVSVIIPIYNMGAYLKECLESVTSQSLREIEIVCVDDGSTDNSAELLVEAAWRDRRIRIISQENQGVSAARNAGLAAARGEYVFFIDPDDWLVSERALSALYDAAFTHGMKASCGSFVQSAKGGAASLHDNWHGRSYGYTITEGGPLTYRDLQFDFGWVRFMYHRATLVENGLWFPSRVYYEDPVWFVKTMHLIGEFWAVPLPVYCYRTGHKDPELSYDQTVDFFYGMGDILTFAADHGYDRLWALSYGRLTHTYPRVIGTHLMSADLGPELEEALRYLNEACERTGGSGHIELDIIAQAGASRLNQERQKAQRTIRQMEEAHSREVASLRQQIEEERLQGERAVARKEEEFLSSRTWKIGNAIWWLPKRIKDLLRS